MKTKTKAQIEFDREVEARIERQNSKFKISTILIFLIIIILFAIFGVVQLALLILNQ